MPLHGAAAVQGVVVCDGGLLGKRFWSVVIVVMSIQRVPCWGSWRLLLLSKLLQSLLLEDKSSEDEDKAEQGHTQDNDDVNRCL